MVALENLIRLTFSFPHHFTETFHMIDKCDSEIATWSEEGDNFVVKNVEKFAGVSDMFVSS